MKIRIKENSVRYRMTKSEVDALAKDGSVSKKTSFNDAVFIYQIVTKKDISHLDVSFSDNTITMFLPFGECETWAQSDRVGFDHHLILNSGETLFLLVEKDFVCLDETVEDQSDNYPNPNEGLLNGK